MADNPTNTYPGRQADVSSLARAYAPAVLVGLAFLYLFKDAIANMADRWNTDPTFSHGWIVAPAAIGIAWFSRDRWMNTLIAPAWTGLLGIVAGLLILLAGAWADVLFLPFVAFVVVLGGMLVYFCGWQLFKRLLFPYGFLWFMVPWPDLLVEQISVPMQLGTSTYSAILASIVGIPIVRDGNNLTILNAARTAPKATFEVAVACSGMHSLVALLCLAAGFAYFTPISLWKRWLLFLLGIPMAFIANVFRVFLILCVGNWIDPQLAAKAFHDWSAPVLFFINTLLLIALRNALMRSPAVATAGAPGAPVATMPKENDDAF
ncbi:MAG TPA: exosortase/archaeosortase family protein [Armatimonadota bacterium]|jgi:exosortase